MPYPYAAGEILTAANLNASSAPIVTSTWVPTVTNFTKGNGTEVARYIRIGATVHCLWDFTFGSSSSISGLPTISLPVAIAYSEVSGQAIMADTGTATYLGRVAGTNPVQLLVEIASGTYTSVVSPSATIPHAWAATDRIIAHWWYFAA